MTGGGSEQNSDEQAGSKAKTSSAKTKKSAKNKVASEAVANSAAEFVAAAAAQAQAKVNSAAGRSKISAKGLEQKAPQQLAYTSADESGNAVRRTAVKEDKAADPYAGVGRNQPCPCGSGKKYKKCHGSNA